MVIEIDLYLQTVVTVVLGKVLNIMEMEDFEVATIGVDVVEVYLDVILPVNLDNKIY